MLISKIIKFKQPIFLPVFVLLHSIYLKSCPVNHTQALSHLQVRWGPFFQSPDSQILYLHQHGLLPRCLGSFLPVQPFQGWAGSYQQKEAEAESPWGYQLSLSQIPAKFTQRLWQPHMDLSLVIPWLSPPMTVPWQQLQLRPWAPGSSTVCLRQDCKGSGEI